MRRIGIVRVLALAVCGVLFAAIGSGRAAAQCARFDRLTVTVQALPTVNYDPFAAGPIEVTYTVTLNNQHTAACNAAIWFVRAAGLPPTMTSGSASLTYELMRPDGSSIVRSSAGLPAQSARFTRNVGANSSASGVFRIRVPAAQLRAAGNYTDLGVEMVVAGLAAGGGSIVAGPRTVGSFGDPSATVISKCNLPAPTTPSLSFSPGDIPNGRPNEGVTKTTSFTNVQCTAPTKLRLTGAALQPSPAIPARTGFDNFINWRAQGTFGAATSTLETAGSTEISADSSQKNVAAGATSNGQIDISVNLKNGQPVQAGTYSGTLTVSIDPSF